jgi:murein DD-endopeptidase MepM/ murein hydrolase activator NlpD
MKFFDRLLTIVVTATLTSAVWIVAGGSLMEMAGQRQADSQGETQGGGTELPAGAGLALPDGDAPSGASAPATGPGAAPAELAALLIPVADVRADDLDDTFLDTRSEANPRPHEAIDIMAAKGTDVVAAGPGTIAKLHRSAAGGNSIYVRSADRKVIYFYAHLDQYATGLREGQRVQRGQRLGTVGSTGNADRDAPHLHFAILETTADAEWWEPANAVNPYPLLKAGPTAATAAATEN